MEKCWRCKKELICMGNSMLSDINEDLGEDDDAMITNYECPNCGNRYFVVDTPICEMEDYPYWVNKNKK